MASATLTAHIRIVPGVGTFGRFVCWLRPVIGDRLALRALNTVLPWFVWLRIEKGRWHRMNLDLVGFD